LQDLYEVEQEAEENESETEQDSEVNTTQHNTTLIVNKM
jgi:hypothetical protein